MRRLTFATLSFAVCLLLAACSQDDLMPQNDRGGGQTARDDQTLALKGDFDKRFNDFARSVQTAVSGNKEFAQLIRQQALQQFDGDYDVLLTHISDKTVSCSDAAVLSRSGDGRVSVGAFLDHCFPAGEVRSRAGEGSVIADLQRQYPSMEISVPVHAEQWDPQHYTPTVVFIPEDFEDMVTTHVPGYDSTGMLVWVDAINDPEVPVIVVGLCDRTDLQGNLMKTQSTTFLPKPDFPPCGPLVPIDPVWPFLPDEVEMPYDPLNPVESPAGLAATQAGGGIFLSWNYTGQATQYYVYRKSVFQGGYDKVAVVTGAFNRSWFDTSVAVHQYYTYYVTAVAYAANSLLYESQPSNTAYIQFVAPPIPDPVTSFTAQPTGNDVELRWSNGGDPTGDIRIEYRIPQTGASYTHLVTKSAGGEDYYIHTPPIKGTRIQYRATRVDSRGTSSAVYDYVYSPFRNVDAVSSIYVNQITLGSLACESWIAGKPEFYLKVLGVTPEGKTVELQKDIDFQFNKRRKDSQFFNRKIYDWYYSSQNTWYSVLTFELLEYDKPSGELKLKLSAKVNLKLPNDLGMELGAEADVTFSNNGNPCGSAWLPYFENPAPQYGLQFPNYGAVLWINQHTI